MVAVDGDGLVVGAASVMREPTAGDGVMRFRVLHTLHPEYYPALVDRILSRLTEDASRVTVFLPEYAGDVEEALGSSRVLGGASLIAYRGGSPAGGVLTVTLAREWPGRSSVRLGPHVPVPMLRSHGMLAYAVGECRRMGMQGSQETIQREPDPRPTDQSPALEWTYRIPLLTSRFMLWDFARVTAISVSMMYLLVAVMGWVVDGEPALLPLEVPLMVGGILLALFFIVGVLMGNRFTMTFVVKADGVTYSSGSREKRWNRAAVLFGALGRNVTTTGAGLLATAGEQGGWKWSDLHSARYFPRQRVISLRNSWRTVLRLHCTAEDYERVRAAVAAGLERGAATRGADTPASGGARGRR